MSTGWLLLALAITAEVTRTTALRQLTLPRPGAFTRVRRRHSDIARSSLMVRCA